MLRKFASRLEMMVQNARVNCANSLFDEKVKLHDNGARFWSCGHFIIPTLELLTSLAAFSFFCRNTRIVTDIFYFDHYRRSRNRIPRLLNASSYLSPIPTSNLGTSTSATSREKPSSRIYHSPFLPERRLLSSVALELGTKV